MSLEGTLDTFSLPEVLWLLGKSVKTGALEVREDGRSRGVLYVAGGSLCGGEAGDVTGPVESESDLDLRLTEVGFTLFRVERGTFQFDPERRMPWTGSGERPVDDVIQRVQQARRDWLEIETIIPSLDGRPNLVDDLVSESLTLDRDAWRVLHLVDGHRSVRAIARSQRRSAFEVCRVLKTLVEEGAVEILPDDLGPVAEVVLPPAEGVDAAVRAFPTVEEADRVPAGHRAASAAPSPLAGDGPSPPVSSPPAPRPPVPDELAQAARAALADLEAHPAGRGADRSPAAASSPPAGDAPSPAEDDGRSAPATTPAPAPAADEGQARDRGALLRLFSGLRESE